MDDFSHLDGLAQAALVASKQVKPAELLESAIARAEAVNPQLNFMAQKLYDRARKTPAGTGPFAGVPFLVKDLHVDIAGERAGEGSHLWDGYVPTVNSTLFDRYEAAGLVTFGKTTSPELGLTVTTESAAYGLTRNPWDLTKNPGDGVGFAAWPAYRVSSGEMWSMQRRLNDCYRQQRFPYPGYASDVTIALGVFMGVNAQGAEAIAPALKR